MSEEFEIHIRNIARSLSYPPTPALQRSARPQRLTGAWRYAALLLLVVGLSGLVIPDIRAGVLEFLQIGRVTVYLDGQGADGQPLNLAHVAGETTLDAAGQQVAFVLLLPPDDPPDRVFVQSDDLVIFVWTDGRQIEKALYQIAGDDWQITKLVEILEQTEVHEQPAYWLSLQHPVQFIRDGLIQNELTHFVAGNVLGWEQDGVTYRLETKLPLVAARALAESLLPLP